MIVRSVFSVSCPSCGAPWCSPRRWPRGATNPVQIHWRLCKWHSCSHTSIEVQFLHHLYTVVAKHGNWRWFFGQCFGIDRRGTSSSESFLEGERARAREREAAPDAAACLIVVGACWCFCLCLCVCFVAETHPLSFPLESDDESPAKHKLGKKKKWVCCNALTCTCMYVDIYVYIYKPAYILMSIYELFFSCVHTKMYIQCISHNEIKVSIYIWVDTLMCTTAKVDIFTHTQTQTFSFPHTHTHIYTHTHTQTYTHTKLYVKYVLKIKIYLKTHTLRHEQIHRKIRLW